MENVIAFSCLAGFGYAAAGPWGAILGAGWYAFIWTFARRAGL